ncbi:hypothetical protein JXA85_05235, partial [Candidatus Woesearchaeota archaeon]|nr:hypothetical protein [Candidatus Woesearchaeota archaeon]
MEEISNRALAVLLVAAITISLGGTILSLNKLGGLRMAEKEMPITGRALTEEGYVNLSISSGISITTTDNNRIDFGSCAPQGGVFTEITSMANASICDGAVNVTGSKNITVRNNGNVNV